MSVLEKIKSILADKNKSSDGQFADLSQMQHDGEIGDGWRGPNSTILPGQQKLSGVDQLIWDARRFFVTRGIKLEDWAVVRREALDLIRAFLQSDITNPEEMAEYQSFIVRKQNWIQELTKKYPPEKVSRWFEMGY